MKSTFIFILSILFTEIYSQTLKGSVYGSDKKVLDNSVILVLRTGAEVRTNANGQFLLKDLQNGDSINVSHVGYQSQKFAYSRSTITISLNAATFQLKDVLISSNLSHLNVLSQIDLKTNPVKSSQELLRVVPGLFIGQHAGGGKAEQIFLRGFDIDHGTDINVSVDGIPVNMVSHAHGQGYADLHFLIPETVEKIDFDKGPYTASKGNLATAGYVEFKTKERLDNSLIKLEAGKFNTYNVLGMLNLVNTQKQSAYIAAEYLQTDGYFKSSQDFNRLNLAGKYTKWFDSKDKFSFGFSQFNSSWYASGQIPERSVQDGSIDHFGAIDDTEGGNTGRTNFNIEYLKSLSDLAYLKNTAYYSSYNFELYSNFTYFLNDPVNGDQIRQKEKRDIFGYQSELNKSFGSGLLDGKLQMAAGFRADEVKDIELSHTLNRVTTLENIQLGDVRETNFYGYASTDLRIGKWLINPALRLDYFRFKYFDKLSAVNSYQAQGKSILSPKLNFLYNANRQVQFFLKTGKGFHSNDTRVVLTETNKKILPAAYGADLGIIWKPVPNLIINSALWYLYLQQEFVYVGDEGVVEPSGKTSRKGIDFGLRYQLNDWLFFNSDLTYTKARAINEIKNDDYLPLSVPFTYIGGISVKRNVGLNGSIRTRHLANRPANEDNSIEAKGYTITDLNLNYNFGKLNLGLMVDNIFSVKWKETQFATESRLQNELVSVNEIHYTPGTPFNIRFNITYSFK